LWRHIQDQGMTSSPLLRQGKVESIIRAALAADVMPLSPNIDGCFFRLISGLRTRLTATMRGPREA
jgi:hypothetical protein